MNPAIPAAGIVWPIIDFTLPSAHRGKPLRAPKTRVSASTSTASPTSVAVPCASTRPTVCGGTPAAS